MDETVIMKLIFAVCGIYLLYTAMQMKLSREIPKFLVGSSFPMSRAKDPEGFIQKTFPFTFGIGVFFLSIGVTGVYGVFAAYPVVDVGLMIALLVTLFFYGKFLLKAQRKYLVGVEDEEK